MNDVSDMVWNLASFLNIKRTWRISRTALALFFSKWRLSLQKINLRRRMSDIANYLEINNVFTWQITLLMKLQNIPLENVHFMDQTNLAPHRPEKSICTLNEGKYLSTMTSECTSPLSGLLQMQGLGQFENLGICFQEVNGVLGPLVEQKVKSHAISKYVFSQASRSGKQGTGQCEEYLEYSLLNYGCTYNNIDNSKQNHSKHANFFRFEDLETNKSLDELIPDEHARESLQDIANDITNEIQKLYTSNNQYQPLARWHENSKYSAVQDKNEQQAHVCAMDSYTGQKNQAMITHIENFNSVFSLFIPRKFTPVRAILDAWVFKMVKGFYNIFTAERRREFSMIYNDSTIARSRVETMIDWHRAVTYAAEALKPKLPYSFVYCGLVCSWENGDTDYMMNKALFEKEYIKTFKTLPKIPKTANECKRMKKKPGRKLRELGSNRMLFDESDRNHDNNKDNETDNVHCIQHKRMNKFRQEFDKKFDGLSKTATNYPRTIEDFHANAARVGNNLVLIPKYSQYLQFSDLQGYERVRRSINRKYGLIYKNMVKNQNDYVISNQQYIQIINQIEKLNETEFTDCDGFDCCDETSASEVTEYESLIKTYDQIVKTKYQSIIQEIEKDTRQMITHEKKNNKTKVKVEDIVIDSDYPIKKVYELSSDDSDEQQEKNKLTYSKNGKNVTFNAKIANDLKNGWLTYNQAVKYQASLDKNKARRRKLQAKAEQERQAFWNNTRSFVKNTMETLYKIDKNIYLDWMTDGMM